MEQVLEELFNGLKTFFLNPLVYWSIILAIISGMIRIKRERKQFGFKLYDLFSEWKHTWLSSLLIGLCVSFITVGIGIVLPTEIWLVVSLVTIVLSLTFSFSLLSPSYTIGVTFLILTIGPFLFDAFPVRLTPIYGTSLVLLLALFLYVEALQLILVKRNQTFPELVLSERGRWIGQHRLKKMSLIPFVLVVPSGTISPVMEFWPMLSIGETSFSFVLVPFLLGFNHAIRGDLSTHIAFRLFRQTVMLGILVTLCGLASFYYPFFSLIAVVLAIIGREFINYRHRVSDKRKAPYFHSLNKGLKVLAIMPGTPADALDIKVGETITKVNQIVVNDEQQFYHALQKSGSYFKLEVLDDRQEIRFVQSPRYEGDHHELGIVFTNKPHELQKTATTNDLISS